MDRAIELNKNYAIAYMNRGLARLEIHGYHVLAIADFTRAISILPTKPFVYVRRAEGSLSLDEPS